MAEIGNRFATMLHKNTYKPVPVLVYAFLEWVLIALLLINSLLGYLISKFASLFGLQKPCLWCSTLDHLFDERPITLLDRLCAAHAAEISLLRLAPAHGLCWPCSPPPQPEKSRLAADGESLNAGISDDDDEVDRLSSSSMFICYEKELVLEGIERQGSDDLIPVEIIDSSTGEDKGGLESSAEEAKESEEKEKEKEKGLGSKVFTSEELYALQINVKKAVITKLNDLPESEFEDKEKEHLKTHVADCEADKDCSFLHSDGFDTLKASDLAQNCHGPNRAEKASLDAKKPLSEAMEPKEDKFPDTPRSTSIEFFEGEDAISTIEKLKTALKSEQKAISALYAELEEERSASAVAANQTMAMITRLQEEKAAMQMEAVQYQRMMEEQSEYDQEALQLLNDLMVKREKEKQELERELQDCRRTILHFEEKEDRIRRNSSFDCDEDDDGLSSIDLNRELRDHEEAGFETVMNLEEIAMDCSKNMSVLDQSLTEFEDERLSILDQLRVLEEKLVKLGDEDGEFEGDLKRICEDVSEEREEDGEGSALLKNNPDGDGERVAIEEEVDHVYERLQALEADREFLNNCMSSVRKGDKGTDLLQEILQHLRDLRTVELRANDEALGEVAVN